MRPWLELARISNLPTVWTNVLAGWVLGGGGWDWKTILWLMLAASLVYTAGMILNDAADAAWDRQNRPERPIPSGKIPLYIAWSVGLMMLALGTLAAVLLAGANVWLSLGLASAILAYDLYHKPWPGSVFIMGSCRALLYLVAGSASLAGKSWMMNSLLLATALALGGYVVGITLVARRESRGSAPGFWQMWGTSAALFLPFLVAMYFLTWGKNAAVKETVQIGGDTALISFGLDLTTFVPLLILAALLWLILHATRLMKTPPRSNIGRSVGLLLAGIVLVDGLAISAHLPIVALICASSWPLLLLWQRKISAT